MKKHLLVGLCSLLLLAACGGSEGGGSTECSLEFWNGTLGTCLPSGWTVLDRETLLLRGVTDELTVVFQADDAVSGQFPIVSVTQQRLSVPADAASFSDQSVKSVATLSGYTLVDLQDISVDGNTVQLHVFRARPELTQPERKFYQMSTISGERGYSFTGMTPVSIASGVEEAVLKIISCATWQTDAEVRAERFGSC